MKKTLLWILVISWALMIFMFSAQPAEDSDEFSLSIGEKIIKIAVSINILTIPAYSDGSQQIEILAEQINHFIRKTAHFTIFLVLGILVFFLAECYKDRKKSVLIALVFSLLFAVSDEFHQLFVPGRAGQIKDVFLDFSGSASGIGLIMLLKYFKEKKNKYV